jgi:hypothetical protein
MTKVIVVPSTIADVYRLAGHLRPGDRDECLAIGLDPRQALRDTFRQAIIRKTYFVDGKLAAMAGLCGEMIGEEGRPFLMTTEAVERAPVAFLKHARLMVAEMLRHKGRLAGDVAASYSKAHRLLEALGFVLGPPRPLGPKGAMFCSFTLRAGAHTARPRASRHNLLRWDGRYAPAEVGMPADGSPLSLRHGAHDGPFIIYTAGRSRTAWLSAFLNYGYHRCFNEAAMTFKGFDDVGGFFAQHPHTGTAETGAAPAWRLLRRFVPTARLVVVTREIDDIVDSFARSEISRVAAIDESKLHKIVAYNDRCLKQISARWDTLTVRFEDLGEEETCRKVFEHCLPYAFDRAWWVKMAGRRIESDPGRIVAYYQAHLAEVEAFKRDGKRLMRQIAREGAVDDEGGQSHAVH